MPVDLSVKRVPDDVAERLRERARQHHRSLQGELRAILEEAADLPKRITVDDVLAWTRSVGLSTPADGAAIVRAGRGARTTRLAHGRVGGPGGRRR
ncbi:MAG: Arc family DNA-binding protein [Vicinamibacterales bacterium]